MTFSRGEIPLEKATSTRHIVLIMPIGKLEKKIQCDDFVMNMLIFAKIPYTIAWNISYTNTFLKQTQFHFRHNFRATKNASTFFKRVFMICSRLDAEKTIF